MQLWKTSSQQSERAGQGCRRSTGQPRRRCWGWILACLAAAAVFAGAQAGQQPSTPNPDDLEPLPVDDKPPAAGSQAPMPEKPAQQETEKAEDPPKTPLAVESAKLFKLATDLKAEVDKTDKDTLSLSVIRRAGEIERLAHSVKEKAKLATHGS